MPASVSVVIPTLNGGDLLRRCLEALQRQEIDRPVELLVIDSGSTDGTLAHCRALGVRVVEIARGTFNHGLTRNAGIQATQGELVALLTQDAVPMDAHWLRHLVAALESTPRAAGAYGRQVPHDDVNPYFRWRLGGWPATGEQRVEQAIDDPRAFEARAPRDKLRTIAFDNVASCIRRRVWEQIPFPRSDFGEDVAWSLQVMRAGHTIVYEPRARVRHSHDTSLWRDFQRVYADQQNLNRLLGMRLVPTVWALLGRTAFGVPALWRDVPLTAYRPTARLYWRGYALPWAFTQNAAQYLGARASERGARWPWPWIDRLIRTS